MNWLDNIVCWISPKAGAQRAAYRMVLEEQRQYDAGNARRLNAGWYANNSSAEETDKFSRDVIRARARDLERNSDIANSVISAYKRNIIGAGINLRVKTGDPQLDKTLKELWDKWCRAKNFDVTGQQSFNQMMRMAVERKKVDGGILFKKCYIKGGCVPFKIQALEVDELNQTGAGKPHGKGNKIVGGIEYNEYNRIVGYYIRQYSVDGWELNEPYYVPAKDMIYLFSKKRPSQIREISDLTPTITRIRDANEFMTAISVKERIAACLAVFIKKLNPHSFGRINENPKNIQEYASKRLTPGMIQELNVGDEIQVVNPSGQSSDAAGMIKLHQRLVGSGQGLSYEATSRDMSQSNYSSARQGAIEDGLTYIEDKEQLIEVVFDEIYETFVISAYLAGYITPHDFWENKEKYMNHEWVPAPKPWIDPQKEANAMKIAVTNGIKTFQQACTENGRDWKEQIEEMAEVLNYGREKGIDVGGIIYGRTEEELYTDGEGTETE